VTGVGRTQWAAKGIHAAAATCSRPRRAIARTLLHRQAIYFEPTTETKDNLKLLRKVRCVPYLIAI
jgi:hypothetical protein